MRSKELASGFVKQAGIAKGILFSALGGATSGGLAGAGLGSLLGGTIGAVKNYRNSAGTFGNRLKAGLTGGLKGGAKGGLIGGGLGAGLGAIGSPLTLDMAAKQDALNAINKLRTAVKEGTLPRKYKEGKTGIGYLLNYLQGMNLNEDNYTFAHKLPELADNALFLSQLKRDALSKSRDLIFNEPNAIVGSSIAGLPILASYVMKNPLSSAKTLFMRN